MSRYLLGCILSLCVAHYMSLQFLEMAPPTSDIQYMIGERESTLIDYVTRKLSTQKHHRITSGLRRNRDHHTHLVIHIHPHHESTNEIVERSRRHRFHDLCIVQERMQVIEDRLGNEDGFCGPVSELHGGGE